MQCPQNRRIVNQCNDENRRIVMKSSLKAVFAFAILSTALCLDLGRLLGLRRDWRYMSSQPAHPQIIEVVRWRQPVCVVHEPGVPPCLVALRKHQDEYETSSAKGIKTNQPEKSKNVVKGQKKIKNEVERAIPEFVKVADEKIEKYCREKYSHSSASNFQIIRDSKNLPSTRKEGKNQTEYKAGGYDNDDLEKMCKNWFHYWNEHTERIQDIELEKSSNIMRDSKEFRNKNTNRNFGFGSGREKLIEQYCTLKLVNINSEASASESDIDSIKIVEVLKKVGILKEEYDNSALDDICYEFIFSPKVLSPQIVDSVHVGNIDRVELDSSEVSARSNLDHTVILNLQSSTPGMEESRIYRQGKYLLISEVGKSTPTAPTPPAIYVTKVLNSPVTATLVANNCFPDIGVPLCDEYQETLTIYKDPTGLTSEATIGNSGQVFQPSKEESSEENVEANSESINFWKDPTSPHFDYGTDDNKPQRPSGLLGQAVQHVLSIPEAISAIPAGVVEAIASNVGVIESLVHSENPEESSTTGNSQTTVMEIKPQIVTNSQSSESAVPMITSRPGFISSFLDIQRPSILDNFWNPGFSIFNRSSAAKPGSTMADNGAVNSQDFEGGLLGPGIGQNPVIETIQNIIHEPETVNTNDKPEFQPVLVIEPTQRPGLFENLWNPALSFGLFNRLSTTTSKPTITGEANVFNSEIGGGDEPQPKPSEAPGLLGGLFNNPSRPNAAIESTDSTPGFLGIGSSFSPHATNKPLIIEKPGAKPLLVEKPIYIQEKPAESAELLSFFVSSSNTPLLNVDHEVIKEPVYVYQKPSSGIPSNVFGSNAALSKPTFFQGWAIFGNRQGKPAERNETNNKFEDVTQEDQNSDGMVEQPAALTAITTDVAKVEKIDEGPTSSIYKIPEAILALQAPSKSAVPVKDIAEKISSEGSVESTTLAIGHAPKVPIETVADSENPASTANISNLPDVEDKVKDAVVAVGAEAILDGFENNFTPTSEIVAGKVEHSEKASVIDNET